MCSTAVVRWVCLPTVAVPADRVFSLSFHLHFFVACIVRRVTDILKFSYLSGVGGNPLVPGLLVDLESAPF
jgi:hypothetical protein